MKKVTSYSQTGLSNRDSERAINVRKEITFYIKELRGNGDWNRFQELMKPRPTISIWWLLRSISLSLVVCWLITVSYWFLPLSILVIARSIRSIGNQCHDMCHQNIFKNKLKNTIYGKYLLMPILWYDFEIYCKEHLEHHAFLGDMTKDPDFIANEKTIKAKDSDLLAFMKLLLPCLFNYGFWRSSAFGDLYKMSPSSLSRVLCFWGVFLFLVWILWDRQVAISFIMIWCFSRMTVYHFIKVFVELCDHAFLNPSSITTYSRTMPNNFMSIFLHPENDSYHTAHHLFPKVSMPNLRRAHKLLMKIERYHGGQHLTSYFFGVYTVIKGLIGRL